MSNHYAYFNGTIRPAHETTLHFTDLGLLRGYGLFDYFRTYNGKPFQWDWYWERYERSARQLGIPNPIDKTTARGVVEELITRCGLPECAIRFILTGGYAEDSVSMTRPNLLIVSEDLHPVNPDEYKTGIKVISHQYVRDMPEIKSTDYKHLVQLMPKIKAAGASDVLFYKDGLISELSRSNVFMVKHGHLITPDENALKGITRRTVLQLAEGYMPVEIRHISFAELLGADEVFTTSTTKRVLPITQIDDFEINHKQVGPHTTELLRRINALAADWK